MQFSVRTSNHQKKSMLNICDPELLGRKIVDGKLTMNISESYYGEKLVDQKEAEILLKNSSIINMVGKETIALSVKLGVGSESGIKIISGIPFLIIFSV